VVVRDLHVRGDCGASTVAAPSVRRRTHRSAAAADGGGSAGCF